eukprot:TRINITY_DN10351_c0_g1_i1.p1 TRINITY_DN10351_c0_g1~~TRINITY_DN10351_c0_g1_i1.p1  ORF type:complete len:594 (-),score=126.42 TRINITY_DN10351_c0_g1_i1:146-1927(-)
MSTDNFNLSEFHLNAVKKDHPLKRKDENTTENLYEIAAGVAKELYLRNNGNSRTLPDDMESKIEHIKNSFRSPKQSQTSDALSTSSPSPTLTILENLLPVGRRQTLEELFEVVSQLEPEFAHTDIGNFVRNTNVLRSPDRFSSQNAAQLLTAITHMQSNTVLTKTLFMALLNLLIFARSPKEDSQRVTEQLNKLKSMTSEAGTKVEDIDRLCFWYHRLLGEFHLLSNNYQLAEKSLDDALSYRADALTHLRLGLTKYRHYTNISGLEAHIKHQLSARELDIGAVPTIALSLSYYQLAAFHLQKVADLSSDKEHLDSAEEAIFRSYFYNRSIFPLLLQSRILFLQLQATEDKKYAELLAKQLSELQPFRERLHPEVLHSIIADISVHFAIMKKDRDMLRRAISQYKLREDESDDDDFDGILPLSMILNNPRIEASLLYRRATALFHAEGILDDDLRITESFALFRELYTRETFKFGNPYIDRFAFEECRKVCAQVCLQKMMASSMSIHQFKAFGFPDDIINAIEDAKKTEEAEAKRMCNEIDNNPAVIALRKGVDDLFPATSAKTISFSDPTEKRKKLAAERAARLAQRQVEST